MSLIERALERLKQETARKEQEASARSQPAATPAATPRAESAERPASSQAAIQEPSRPLPCRADRTVHIEPSALRASGVIAPASEERRLAEEYRIIKRPLLKVITSTDPKELRNLVAVTSALPGEGKTFTSINLALSLALERGREVVLVDGDTAKRHVTHVFGLDGEPGLLDAGADAGSDLEHTVLPTDIPSFYILPAGRAHAEATEILRSERTAALLTSLASNPRRIVLIDTAPMLVTSEAGVMAALAGQVLLVVKASETPQEVVVRAVEAIAEDKPVSLVLNQVLAAPERHYGYYYGGYGYGRPAYGSESATDTIAKEEAK
jgi:exopolysaccharide/PEP-CTERM locus tyrosine autokinase